MHWLMSMTAMLNSSAIRTSCPRCFPSYQELTLRDIHRIGTLIHRTFCCLSDSSPLPENSTRNNAK